jgi:Tfp pilus assembly protein PilN
MFTIDLLKGQNLPVRTKPQGVAIFVATFTVPVLVAMLMAGYYVRNGVIISVQKQSITGVETQTQRLADALKLKESCEKDKSALNNCLADVAASIRKHIQWSPVLVALAENLPDSVVITGLEVKKNFVKRKIAAQGDSADQKADTSVPVRTLKMRVSGNPSYNCDLEVRAFRDQLRASKVLGPMLEDIVIASQGHDTLDGRDVVCYDIECIFKPGL